MDLVSTDVADESKTSPEEKHGSDLRRGCYRRGVVFKNRNELRTPGRLVHRTADLFVQPARPAAAEGECTSNKYGRGDHLNQVVRSRFEVITVGSDSCERRILLKDC